MGDMDLAAELARLLSDSPENRLLDFPGCHIFDAPVIGIADGDDPVFEEFLQAVSPNHFLPRQLMEEHFPAADLSVLRVVSWAFPFSAGVRQSNREGQFPSKLYSMARNNGAALMEQVAQRMLALLDSQGAVALVPASLEAYTASRCSTYTFTSTWSERHVAYAAGLGRFGLSGALLTPVGSHVRFSSLVVNLPLSITSRPDGDYRAPCLESGGETCNACITRCPVGAISSEGMDKSKCYQMRQRVRETCLVPYEKEFHLLPATVSTSGRRRSGFSLGCALCQCGVPCEGMLPEE